MSRRTWPTAVTRSVVLGLALVTAACRGGDDEPVATGETTSSAPSTLPPSTSTVPPTSTSVATTVARPSTTVAPTATKAATAVIEPHTVAGLPLGATKTEVIAVLGPPTRMGQETDVSGARYDYLRWEFDGNRGLNLNFRTPNVTSPRLTDWTATAKGPRTRSAIQVGDPAGKVVAAHGPLQTFCCDARIASVTQGPGRMIIVVHNGNVVGQIIGGDEASWSRSIAD